jgi:hypothetical protein
MAGGQEEAASHRNRKVAGQPLFQLDQAERPRFHLDVDDTGDFRILLLLLIIHAEN